MFYLSTHSFYLWLYGVRHMVKGHSDSETGNPLPPHGLQQVFFYMHHPADRTVHTVASVTHVVEGRKEMFYLTSHKTHFIYGYMA